MSYPANTPGDVLDRLDIGDCWLFTGGLSSHGYATIRLDRHDVLVHRAVYEMLVGKVPEGLVLDHLCRVRHCANPDHLEPVTCRENLMRGATDAARKASWTHCLSGHPFDEVNTARRSDGTRRCRACAREATARYRARRAAA